MSRVLRRRESGSARRPASPDETPAALRLGFDRHTALNQLTALHLRLCALESELASLPRTLAFRNLGERHVAPLLQLTRALGQTLRAGLFEEAGK